MSLPRYPEYNDSGVAWLGEVPAHWLVTPVKRFGRLKGGAGFPHVEQGHESEDLPFHKVNALGRSGSDGVLWGSENNISQATAERLGAYVFPAESLVFAKVGAALLLGRIRVLGEPACIDNNMMGLVVDRETADFAFVSYALNLVRFDLIANPGAVPSLNEGQIGNFPLVLPSRAEQSAIAAFLDRETGKIDALIAEQEKLLTLLAEKRQATISHAVTRGLNPNVPMKDSGVPWLGEVPANWDVCAIKRMTAVITDGAHVSPETEGGSYDFVSTKDVGVSGVDFDGALKTSASSYEYLVRTGCKPQRGDVLFSKDGTIGRTVVVDEEREFVVASSLIIIRPDARVLDGLFLHYLCQSFVVRQQVDGFVKGAGLPRLSIQNLTKVLGVFPSLPEQHAIAQFLDTADNKWSALKVNAECAIALLKERRRALIAAAVTGKIDVRSTS